VNRDSVINELVKIRLAAKKNVTNATALSKLIRGDLEQLTDDELQRDYAYATGASHKPSTGSAVDYRVSDLDHALTLAAHLISRTHQGERTFTNQQIASILQDEYGPTISGRALSMALDESYKISHGRSQQTRVDTTQWRLITLDEFRKANPELAIPEALEPPAS
jgi:hypothetical protein